MRVITVAFILGLLFAASTGFTETEQNNAPPENQPGYLSSGMLEFGGGVLMSFVQGSSLYDFEPVFGYFVTPGIELEVGLGFKHMQSNGDSYTIRTAILKALRNFDTATFAAPYGFCGFGFQQHSVSYRSRWEDKEVGALLRFGGGLRLFPTRSWNLRAELQFEKVYIEDIDEMSTNMMLYITGLVDPVTRSQNASEFETIRED
jgi:hypothetical protein